MSFKGAINNFYVRLVQRGQLTINDVPEDCRDEVSILLKSAPPITPREGEFEKVSDPD